MSLGLERGKVSLSAHDLQWHKAFEVESALLSELIGDVVCRIEHIGSTAVEGLVAKPIIDIAASVADLTLVQQWAGKLEAVGYVYFGDRENRGDHFFAKGPEARRTVYLHVVGEQSALMDQYVRFRDRLRTDRSAKRRYTELKERLAALYGSDRRRYTAEKTEFIAELSGESE